MPDFDLDKIGVKPTPPRPDKPQGASTSTTTKKYGSTKGFTFYKLQSVPANEKSYKITKFDNDLNVESSYYMNYMPSRNNGYYDCQCPASRFDCRHKAIMQTIVEAKQVDGEKFFCFETRTFKLATEIGRA